MVHGFALLICQDQRDTAVKEHISRLSTDVPKQAPGVSVKLRPVRFVFGTRPYNIFMDLDAPDQGALAKAFDYIEQNFSHIDGFI